MRNIHLLLVAVLLSVTVSAQVSDLNLNTPETGNMIREATKSVRLLPGFSYKSSVGETFIGRINRQNGGNNDLPYYNDAFRGNVSSDPDYVGSISGNIDVNQLGGAIYTIPLTVPPGTASVQPNISIVYNSQSGNGLLGVKWSIGGLSAISRTNKNIFFDDKKAGISFSEEDALIFDGQRLIRRNDGSFMTYHESFSKITLVGTLQNGWFKVENKDGSVMEYGKTINSRVSVSEDTPFTPLVWRLNRLTDTNGNYIEYIYDIFNGESLLKQINYTGNDQRMSLPYNSIVFNYKQRMDINYQELSKGVVSQSHILTSVVIYCENSAFKEYSFEYAEETSASRLIRIIEKNTEEEFTSLKINWGSTSQGKIGNSISYFKELNDSSIHYAYCTGDFDGDGITDFLVFSGIPFIDVKLIFTDGRRFKLSGFPTMTSLSNTEDFLVADFDGDGKDDLLLQVSNIILEHQKTYKLYLSKGNFFEHSKDFIFKDDSNISGRGTTLAGVCPLVGDFTGNGKVDLLFVSKYTKKVYPLWETENYTQFDLYELSTLLQTSFTTKKWTSSLPSIEMTLKDKKEQILDIDGDGIMEFLVYEADKMKIYSLKEKNLNLMCDFYYPGVIYVADINGDGKSELMVFDEGSHIININSGRTYYNIGKFVDNKMTFGNTVHISQFKDCDSGFIDKWKRDQYGSADPADIFSPTIYATCDRLIKNKNIIVQDFNGDGKTDILEILTYEILNALRNPLNNEYYSLRKTEMILRESGGKIKTRDLFEIVSIDNIGDFNGDGNLDLLSIGKNEIYSFFNENTSSENIVASIEENSLEKKIEISYARSTNKSVHGKGSGSVFPYNDHAGPLWLVSEVRVPDGLGGQNKIQYRYSGLTLHRQGLGFLGFKSTTITDVTQAMKETTVFSELNTPVKAWVPIEKIVSALNGDIIFHSQMKYQYMMPASFFAYGYNVLSNVQSLNYLSSLKKTTDYVYDLSGNLLSEEEKTEDYTSKTSNDYGKYGSWVPNKIIRTSQKITDGTETYERKTEYRYDYKGNLLSATTDPSKQKSITKIYTYNDYGIPLTESLLSINEEPRTKSFGFDDKKRFITSCQNDLGQQLSILYDHTTGNRLSSTNLTTGLTQTNTYNHAGQLTETVSADGISTKIQTKKVSNTIVPNARYYVLTETQGQPYQKVYYDILGRKLRTETQGYDSRISADYTYNAKGQLASVSDPYKENEQKAFTSYTYDQYGRIKTTQYRDLVTTYNYEKTKTTTTDPAGRSTVQVLNTRGETAYIIDPEGNRLDYQYHPSGKLRQVKSGSQVLMEMSYDEYGQQVSMKDADAGIMQYQYNAYGQLTRQQDALGHVFELKYDKYGRIVRKDAPNGAYLYQYSTGNDASNGQLVSISGPDNMGQQYEYDRQGRVLTFTDNILGEALKTKYGYNQWGHNIMVSYPYGYTIENKYNKAGYLYEVRDVTNSVSIWKLEETDAFGNALKIMNGNGLRTEYNYDEYKNLAGIKTGNVQHLEYDTESPERQLISARHDRLRNITETFQYDNQDQLLQSQVNGNPDPLSVAYNVNGSPQFKSGVGLFQYHPDKPHAVKNISNDAGLISPAQQHIVFNAFNKPASITEGNYKYSIAYDVNNERSKMLAYENDILTMEKTYALNYEREIRGNQIRETHYIPTPSGTTAIFRKETGSAGNLYYLCKDHLGSVTTVADQLGNVRERFAYDPWGRRVNPDNWNDYNVPESNFLSRGYTGHEHLDRVGLINMNGRMYDPVIGRMLSPDNLIPDPASLLGYDRYSYCYNNPMHFTDPDGENPILFASVLATVICLGKVYSDGYDANGKEWNPFKWDWKSATYAVGYTSNTGNVYMSAGWGTDYGVALTFNAALGLGVTSTQNLRSLEEMPFSIFKSNQSSNPAYGRGYNLWEWFQELSLFTRLIYSGFDDSWILATGLVKGREGAMHLDGDFTFGDEYLNAGMSTLTGAFLMGTGSMASAPGRVAPKIGTTGFRYMSQAELKAIQETGYLRGGWSGETYFTKDLYKSATKAQSRLSLGSSPALRVEFDILNNPTFLRNGTKVTPLNRMIGGGSEFMTLDPVKVRLINWQPLR